VRNEGFIKRVRLLYRIMVQEALLAYCNRDLASLHSHNFQYKTCLQFVDPSLGSRSEDPWGCQ
jgi:hypothetical protein